MSVDTSATTAISVERPLPSLLRFITILMILVATSAIANDAQPTGASLAWTSNDSTIVRARSLLADGKFTQAEAELELSSNVDPAARDEMLEIISRLRHEYPFSAAQMLQKLADPLPGTTAVDIERWRTDGGLQWRMIDGKPAFFRREPANLFRFCGEAAGKRKPAASNPNGNWTLADHLKKIIESAEKTSATQLLPIRHRVTFSLTIPAHAPGMKQGALVRAWLPFPQEHQRQTDIKLISASPKPVVTAPATQRTAYFEQRVIDPNNPLIFKEVFEFTSSAYYPALDDSSAKPLASTYAGDNLSERPPHIVFTPQLKSVVDQLIASDPNPLSKARKIFQWINQNIAYHAEEEYSVIPSFTAKALATRRGDCGIQSMLFISMCRYAGVPARWQSGWETKPVGYDMHDWAEFYVEPWGWLPADPSYGFPKIAEPPLPG